MLDTLRSALSDRYLFAREIGVGGMATVYLAHDLRHDRDVALKILRPELAAVLGPERFLSEIRVTAKLQHPNLLPLFDSGECEGQFFYVMPFIEGETLRTHLTRERQLSVRESVRIAAAIASALDYAHRHGVIHRDLKPENILLHEGQPLVADFGIAFAVSNSGGERVTQTGISLGTPQYMSPEQATGERVVDGRSDIYSLGAVLHEMLTGEPPHTGATVQAVLSRVLTNVPRRVREIRPSIPEHLDAAVAKALEKVPADRFENAREFAEVLQGQKTITGAQTTPLPVSSGHASTPSRSRFVRLAAAGAVAVAGTLAVTAVYGRTADVPEPVSFVLTPTAGEDIQTTFAAFSPNGRTLVYLAALGGITRIYVRPLAAVTSRPLPGTEGAQFPFFSPDGNWIAFFANGELRRIPLNGGPAITVAKNVEAQPSVWMDAEHLLVPSRVVSLRRDGLSEMAVASGKATTVMPADTAHGEDVANVLPLADGRTVLFKSKGPGGTEDDFLAVGSLQKHDRTIVNFLIGSPLAYVDGFAICVGRTSDGVILAIPIDVSTRRITGDPITLEENVNVNSAVLSLSGTLAFATGRTTSEVSWIDDAGKISEVIPEPRAYTSPRLSPDEQVIAVTLPSTPTTDVSLYNIQAKTLSKLTSNGAVAPEWSPDGRKIIYVRPTTSGQGMWTQRVDGSEGPVQLRPRLPAGVASPSFAVIAPDETTVMFTAAAGNNRSDIFYFKPGVDSDSVHAWLATGADERDARFSPDGKWVVYSSDESGVAETFVRPFPGPGGRIQISSGGGGRPRWSTDGRTIYYRNGANIIAASLNLTPAISVRFRRTAFTGAMAGDGVYDVSRDGKRVLFARPAGGDTKLIIATGWLAEARRKLREGAR